ncbi:MAG: pyridoxal-phosphate dependent enzyme, partial [Deltaproteobacteria bacterium]|nr:pyridoxal-phosphate dependent enzyme [Deltaproteobacteria bacterium]
GCDVLLKHENHLPTGAFKVRGGLVYTAALGAVRGLVSEHADAYARSFEQRAPIPTDSADTLADGMAVRVPHPDAVDMISRHAARVVRVSDDEVGAAIRHLLSDTHQLAEGAGAAPLAALLKERERMRGKKVALILSGANIDRAVLGRILLDA